MILLFFVIGLSVLQSSKIALIEGSKLAVLMLLAGVLFTCFVAFEGRELARMLSNFAGHKFSGSGFYSYQYMPHSVFCYFLKILMLGGAWTFLLPWALWKSTESCRLGGPGCFGLAAERRWSAALLWGVAVIAVLLYPAPVESSAFLIALLPTFAVGLSVMLSFTIETHSQWFLARWLPELYRMAALLLQVIAISYLLLLGFAQSPYTGWLLWLDEALAYLWKHALLIFPAAVLALLTSRIALRQLFSPAFPLAVAMLIALPVYIGTGIRAEYQEFPYRAQEIQRHLDQQETLLVVAAENSQELYPLLYYLRNQFRQVNPDITGLACPGLYLSTGAWLESQNSVPGNVVIVARSRSSLSRRDAGLNDEVLIFRCLEEVPRAAI